MSFSFEKSIHTQKCEHPCLRLMEKSTGFSKSKIFFRTSAFTFRFESLPLSSCLSHLTLLVSQLSSRDKFNLICDARLSFVQCAALSRQVQF